VVPNLEDFESEVLKFIQDQSNGQLPQKFDVSLGCRAVEVNLTHLGRLLAALALGVQYSSLNYTERTNLAKKYGLRFFNVMDKALLTSQKLKMLIIAFDWQITCYDHL
jgi:hypothetical protein